MKIKPVFVLVWFWGFFWSTLLCSNTIEFLPWLLAIVILGSRNVIFPGKIARSREFVCFLHLLGVGLELLMI